MKIATWNLNGIRARYSGFLNWLDTLQPDICLLQELRCETDIFPFFECEARGYQCAVHGQKARNGVAILSKEIISHHFAGFPHGYDADNARVISARVNDLSLISVYVPNGHSVYSAAFEYKRDFLRELRSYISSAFTPDDKLILAGDFNVAPNDNDVYDPAECEDSLCCHPDERADLAQLVSWGFYDALRIHEPDKTLFSWWDYRKNAYINNIGLRLDLILISLPLLNSCSGCTVDTHTREADSPSDHAPVIATFTE